MNRLLITSFQPLLATSRWCQWSLAWKDSPRVILSALGLALLWDNGQRGAQINWGGSRGGEAQHRQTLRQPRNINMSHSVCQRDLRRST